ncbi:hypothetical protein SCACP_38420 [Sporomusa carbonis]
MKSNKDFFLGVLLVTLHRWRLTYAYTNNTPVHLYWISDLSANGIIFNIKSSMH